MNEPVVVLMVEDNRDLRGALQDYLGAADGIRCAAALPNAAHVLKEIARYRPQVVLMDIDLPGMNGIEAVKLIKAHQPDVEVLMLTVFDDNEHVYEAVCAGATGYLLKSSTPAEIVEAIHNVASGGAPMTAAVARKILQHFSTRAEARSTACSLNQRESEVLKCLTEGYTYKLIAARLHISIDTVRFYIKRIYEKLQVHSAPEAIAKAMQQRLI